jgi:hypothetical protein
MTKAKIMTRPINLKSVPLSEQPLSEQYRHTAKLWCEADAAASLLEETKGAELEERKIKLIAEQGDMPDNKAERIVRGSPEWMDRLRMGCEARSKANLLKVQLKYIEIKHSEWLMHNAAARKERELINRGM